MSGERRISVVIVNWNAGPVLEACLGSLYACHTGYALDVVLVDNASADGSTEAVEREQPQVRVLRNGRNLGFAAAVNRGLAAADPANPWLLVLNPDTRFTTDSLGQLIDFLEQHPDAAAAGPKVVGPDGRLQRGCRRREPAPLDMLWRTLGLDLLFPDSPLFAAYTFGGISEDSTLAVDSISGSFMLIRRDALDKVGPFDERFFMYAEDLDWCRRAREAGWRVFYHPVVEVVHERAVSSRQRPLARLWHINHTAWQYIRKHNSPLLSAPINLALYLALSARFLSGLPAAILCALRPGRDKTKV